MKMPTLPLTSPQKGDQPGTWAYRTIETRFPRIARRVIEENSFSQEIQARILALADEIPAAPIRSLADPGAKDVPAWETYIRPYLGMDWHQPPWWFTEHYFYRRILEACGYFQPGENEGLDPYRYQKQRGLAVSESAIHNLATWLQELETTTLQDGVVIERLLQLDLWGNQADLSLWPAEAEAKPDHQDLEKAASHILVDHTSQVAGFLAAGKPHAWVDFLVDNAGFELVGDLAFGYWLLASGIVEQVRLHVKAHPTYVSDAVRVDVLDTIAALSGSRHPATRHLGYGLQALFGAGRLQVWPDPFWNSPLDGWQMPEALGQELARSALVISKGDAHYRRLLGDRHWPYETRFEDILAYYPAPLVALRTLKSELLAGLVPGQAAQVASQDPEWMLNGRWGLVQSRI